ncbi:MAG: hypothetical protein JWM28_2430 [Chitinophagaceae bacterium]|nr:hypothetical protein [Chitinophagaceae bacterium]
MPKAALLFPGFFYCLFCFGQQQKKIVKVTASYTLKQTEFIYRLGDADIGVVVYKYNNNPGIVLVSPHDDEETAIEVSKKALRKLGGTLIKINNNKKRLITFNIHGSSFQFDPNRIFTHTGIITSLKKYGNYSPSAVSKIKSFAKFILSKIPSDTRNVIALHNNHKGQYSIDTYDNGNLFRDSRAVYIDSSRDKDDFFLTTNEVLYNKIRGYRYNVILQNNDIAKDDGSLSIYFGRKNKSYVNVETEHGKSDAQLKMLMIAINPPKRKNNNTVLYNYEIPDSVVFKNAGNLKIYFGEQQVGTLLSAYFSPARNITFGQLEANKNFPLDANNDFFLSGKATNLKIDVRIDPTRKGKPINRLKETIQVAIRK